VEQNAASGAGMTAAGGSGEFEFASPDEGKAVRVKFQATRVGARFTLDIAAESRALIEDSSGDKPREVVLRASKSPTLAVGEIYTLELENAGDRAKHHTLEICVRQVQPDK
jgi:hypothetical protein